MGIPKHGKTVYISDSAYNVLYALSTDYRRNLSSFTSDILLSLQAIDKGSIQRMLDIGYSHRDRSIYNFSDSDIYLPMDKRTKFVIRDLSELVELESKIIKLSDVIDRLRGL